MRKSISVLFNFLFVFTVSFAAVNTSNDLAIEANTEYSIYYSGIDGDIVDNLSAGGGGVPTYVPDPSFDTVEVRADGTVFLRINLQGKLTTGTYRIFEIDTLGTPLATVNASQDSIVVLSGADLNIQNIVIQAIDSCNPNVNRPFSAIYNTILPSGSLTDSCAGEYTLSWQKPGGFPNDVSGYRVYTDFDDGNGFVLVTIITDKNTTSAVISGISKGRNYRLQVVAFDARGAVNVSAIDTYSSPPNLATNYLVPAPTPRCTYVNDDGSVTLSWIPANDSVNNFDHYNIQYKRPSESIWTEIPGGMDDLLLLTDENFTVTGINAQLEQYDFQITSMAGCDGNQPSTYNEISSIYLGAIPLSDAAKSVRLVWNQAGPDYGTNNFFELFKRVDSGSFSFIGNSFGSGLFNDSGNTSLCNSDLNYHASLIDTLFSAQGFSCNVKSNVATARVFDTIPPRAVNLQAVSYDLSSGGLNVFWDGSDPEDISYINFYTLGEVNSGIQSQDLVLPSSSFSLNPSSTSNQLLIPFDSLDARDASVMLASLVSDACGNSSNVGLSFHQTMTMNVGWLVKDSINKLSWNAYVGFNEDFDVEYDVFYTNALTDSWINAGSAGTQRTFEHKVPDGNQLYYYHVKASSKDTLLPIGMVSNSNIGLVYSAFVDTTIGITENSLKVQLRLYPNPVREQLILNYSGDKELDFQLYNAQGQSAEVTINKTENTYLFQVQSLSIGFYIININDGELQTSLKFLKE